MQEQRLRAELLGIWKTFLASDSLTIDDDFFEMGGDSLLANEMVLEVERRLDISIPDSLLFEASTVKNLAAKLARPAQVQRKAVYQISETIAQTPLLFFHGDWNNGGYFLKNLARYLGPGQSMVAVAPHGVNGERVPGSLKEMAADRLPQILEFQPRGPFFLGGHCVGGIVALETARLLIAEGHDVQVVAMVDPVFAKVARKLESTPGSMNAYKLAMEMYELEPLVEPVPILVFSSEFDGKPWQHVSPDFKLFDQPGGHYDWVTVNSAMFADHLRDELQRIADQMQTRP